MSGERNLPAHLLLPDDPLVVQRLYVFPLEAEILEQLQQGLAA